jgi:hypothetical protein
MQAYKITWDDGNTTTTDMNATLDEAKRYYIGRHVYGIRVAVVMGREDMASGKHRLTLSTR